LGRYEDAVIFAATKHNGQKRKDGTPYIAHPMRVAAYLAEKGCSEDCQIAGLLHDVLEDTDATEEEVALFGENILKAVKLVSKNYSTDHESYLAGILQDEIATMVKDADRIDNLKDAIKSDDLAFQERYLKDTYQYINYFSEELNDMYGKLLKEVQKNIPDAPAPEKHKTKLL